MVRFGLVELGRWAGVDSFVWHIRDGSGSNGRLSIIFGVDVLHIVHLPHISR